MHKQLEAITSLQVSANRFSEQIAELLLIGDPELPDFESARAELEVGFDNLEKMIVRGSEGSNPSGIRKARSGISDR